MITRANLIKLAAVLVIAAVGIIYWYYADRRTGPAEELEKTVIGQTY